MKLTSIALLLLSVAAGVPAQTTYAHSLPYGFDTLDGNYQCYPVPTFGGTPFNTSLGSSRWQWTYGWNQFFHQHPAYITQLAFRRDGNFATAGGQIYPNVTITMASLAPAVSSHLAMSGTFANNLGPDQLIVFNGPITIPALLGGAFPAPFNLVIPLSLPFAYDPTALRDLVIDITVPAGATVAGGFMLDGVYPSAGVSQNGHTTNASSATRNAFNADAGAIVEVTYQLGNPVSMDLIVATSGGGIGDLYYQIIQIPPAALHGYTVISTTPSSVFNVPFGRGPLFGIYPNILTFNLLISPAAVGDPFHWLLPAGGFFPDSPLTAPPGALSSFSGQTWELVAVVFGPAGTVVGISPPRQLIW